MTHRAEIASAFISVTRLERPEYGFIGLIGSLKNFRIGLFFILYCFYIKLFLKLCPSGSTFALDFSQEKDFSAEHCVPVDPEL
jgi:hypothetical protein